MFATGVKSSAAWKKGASVQTARMGDFNARNFVLAELHKLKRRRKRSAAPIKSDHGSKHGLDSLSSPSQDSKNSTSAPSYIETVRSVTAPKQPLAKKQNFVPTMDDIVEEQLSRTALTEFYQRGINGESPWFIYREDGWIRIAYIGNATSNLTHLVQGELSNSTHGPSLHFPFPSIRPTMPWKPQKDQPIVRWYSRVADDAGALPAKEVRDDLVNSFFEKIHPGFPIVDEAEFRSQYSNPEHPPPLLLLQSVLLAGAHVCQHPKVAESRALVKMALFRRAKALFEMHFENDRMNLVQCALLFTWHFEGADDASSNVYYWAGVACRIAYGLGMHRDLSQNSKTRMPAGDCRIYRRIWWTLVQVDVLASLHHGRPPMIDPDECDQSPLIPEDFVEYCGSQNQNVNIEYNIQNSKLCDIVLQILKLSSPGSLRRCALAPGSLQLQQKSLNSQLAGWYMCLAPDILSSIGNHDRFWSLQVQMHYNLALMHLHRIPTDSNESRQYRSTTCHVAAHAITKLFDEIITIGAVSQCSFTALTALLSAAIQISSEARAAANDYDIVLALEAQTRLENLLPAIKAVSHYWPSAEAISHIFHDVLLRLQEQCKAIHAKLQADSQPRSPSEGIAYPVDASAGVSFAKADGGAGAGVGWSNFFEMGDLDPFADIEASGLESWLTMPTSGDRFAE
ncbi:hypothetical protein BP5796_03519 [Coleophoma crateriformis]|uniref:Xylanolytic transcriptional activator regulatory domain-containing protein n=1 Tax=Coleophoma crateriformis TaxID=565419 RepID=A0A3D8SNC1_9HELO|nr:hypothetical protein BP5796_03519 [Coleophoma crateriformis]